MHVSHAIVRLVAAAVWYGGSIALVLKAWALLDAAHTLRPSRTAVLAIVAAGIVLGALKARFFFLPACRRNLRRIAALRRPQPWQCYRPAFFAFLALMIGLGTTLSRAAAGSHGLLLGVALLDLSIATALLGGGLGFWSASAVPSPSRPERSGGP